MSKNKDELERELKECGTLNQMWAVLDKYYNLDHKVGTISKSIIAAKLVNNITSIQVITRLPER